MNKRRIDEIRERFHGSRFIYIETDNPRAFENKKNIYNWSFQGTYHDALFMVKAYDDIGFLLGEIDRLEAEAEGDVEDD